LRRFLQSPNQYALLAAIGTAICEGALARSTFMRTFFATRKR
jgi:hypothetical protein